MTRNKTLSHSISNKNENALVVDDVSTTMSTLQYVVNTLRLINDENELKELCIEKGWNLEWYKKYKNYFNIR